MRGLQCKSARARRTNQLAGAVQTLRFAAEAVVVRAAIWAATGAIDPPNTVWHNHRRSLSKRRYRPRHHAPDPVSLSAPSIAMASGWAHFRKTWLKPEVYPLIGAMAAALGAMSAALINKARSPNVAWDKSKRTTGGIFDDVEEIVPLWNSSKKNSTGIFTSDSGIQDSKKIITEDLGTFVIKTAEEEPEEEEEEEQIPEPIVETSAVEQEEPAVVQPAFDIIDESAEAINAAVDAAIQTASSITPAHSAETSIPETPPVEQAPAEQILAEQPPAEQPPAAASPVDHPEPAHS